MIDGKSVLAIIPARGGSKGISKKNIFLIKGKPLIYYSINAAKKSHYIDKLIVSTEDEEILKVAKKLGVEVVKRDRKYSEDNIPLRPDLMKYIAKEQFNDRYDIIVMIMAPCVLVKTEHIDKVIEKIARTDAEWVTTICEAERHPFRMRKIIDDNLVPIMDGNIWAQRQDLPKIYDMEESVFATKKYVLDKKECLENSKWAGVIIPKEYSLDIHELKDITIAEAMLSMLSERENENK